MRVAEWIQAVTFSYFVALAWARRLPDRRRLKVTGIGVVGLTATGLGAFALPLVLPPLPVSVARDWLPAALVLLVYWQAGAFFVRVDRQFQDRLERLDERITGPLLRWIERRRARA